MHIITCLGGGLGNQLFQYAAGRSLAARTGARLMMDGSRIQAPGGYRYVLGNFAIDAELVFGREHGAAADSIRTEAEDRLEFPIFREHSFDYDPRFETLSGAENSGRFLAIGKVFPGRCRNHSIRIPVDPRGARRERSMARRSQAGDCRVRSRSAM